jgi:hypothetical protein
VPSRDKSAARRILGKIYQRKSIEARAGSEKRITTAGCQSVVATHGSPGDTPVAGSAMSTDLIAKPAKESTTILKKTEQAQISFESLGRMRTARPCANRLRCGAGNDLSANEKAVETVP